MNLNISDMTLESSAQKLSDALVAAKIQSDLDKKHWREVKKQYEDLGMTTAERLHSTFANLSFETKNHTYAW